MKSSSGVVRFKFVQIIIPDCRVRHNQRGVLTVYIGIYIERKKLVWKHSWVVSVKGDISLTCVEASYGRVVSIMFNS